MNTDEKLVCIFEQINKTYDRIGTIESQQTTCNNDMKNIKQSYLDLDYRLQKMENLCKTQALQSKALSYKSIDAEARSMRNNIVIYGLT